MKKIYNLMLTVALTTAPQVGLNAGETAYGYLFGDMTGNRGFVSFDVDAPQNLTILKNTVAESIHVSAGEYVDGKIYTYRVDHDEMFNTVASYDFTIYDATTFEVENSVNMKKSNRVVDMSYDYTTNTMYALVEDKYTTSSVYKTSLYVVDMKTGKYSLIGNPGDIKALDGYGRPVDDKLLTLACDQNGKLYAMSHFRTLYNLDKFTGLATPAAPQHNLSTINQLQSMTFSSEGKLWWAQSHPDYGFFCEIDLTTGIPGGFVDFKTDYDKLNKLGSDGQLTSLYFNNKKVNDKAINAVSELASKTKDDDCNSVILTWQAPTTDYSNNVAEVAGYNIYRIGSSEPIAELAADATTFTDQKAPNGIVTYEIIPFNANGKGFPAFTQLYAGYDMLDVVNDIIVKLEDKTTTLTWTKPTQTVNGGYANFDAITYNVYRCQGTDQTLVAEATTETTFSETIEKAGGYNYIIEPISGSVVGKPAESDKFLITSIATIPYFTGFEDNQDGALWTIINNTTKGWAILNDYSKYDGKCAKASTGGATALGNDWIISPAINFEPGKFVLDFYAYGSSFDKSDVDFFLGTNSSDATTFTLPVYSIVDENVNDATATPKGWKHYEAKFAVATGGIYHLGIYNKTKATYASFRIDNISINSDTSGAEIIDTDKNDIIVLSANNVLSVKASKNINNIAIFDMQGRCITSKNINATEYTLSHPSISNGIYIVSVILNDGSRNVTKITVK